MNLAEQLGRELADKELTVRWEVLCDIGPNWIGGSRSITFYLDKSPLEDKELSTLLTSRLIEVLDVPDKSEDFVINGYGKFFIQGADLMIQFKTEANIPYDDKFYFDKGVKFFLTSI